MVGPKKHGEERGFILVEDRGCVGEPPGYCVMALSTRGYLDLFVFIGDTIMDRGIDITKSSLGVGYYSICCDVEGFPFFVARMGL